MEMPVGLSEECFVSFEGLGYKARFSLAYDNKFKIFLKSEQGCLSWFGLHIMQPPHSSALEVNIVLLTRTVVACLLPVLDCVKFCTKA